MSRVETYLTETYSYMRTRGKRGRMVPFVYSSEIKNALDTIVKYRETVGISPENKYLFANSVKSYIRGGAALNELVEECNKMFNLEKPQ